MRYCSPYIYVPMPVDKDGNGPIVPESAAFRTIHEVWDGANITVCECSDKEAAMLIAKLLEEWNEKRGS